LLSAFSFQFSVFAGLEVELPGKLHHSTGASGRYLLDGIDLPEGATGKVINRRAKIRVVEGVEGLQSQLEVHRLCKVNALLQSHVPEI
jgi:hypothetical protein